MTSTETRTVQERLRGNSTACLVNGLPDTAALLSEAADRIDELERVQTLYEKGLSSNQIKALMQDGSYDERAAALNISIGTMKSRVHRACKKLGIPNRSKLRSPLSPPSDNEVKS